MAHQPLHQALTVVAELAALFKLFTVADLLALFPKDSAPTKVQLEKLIKESGLYRDVAGKMILLESDVRGFFDWVRAAPAVADQRDGAGGLLRGAPPAPHSIGTIVVIAEQGLVSEDMVYVGWAPHGEVAELTRRVQFGCPFPVAVKAFRPGTPSMLAELEQDPEFSTNWVRGGWYGMRASSRKALNTFMEPKETDDDVEHAET